MNKLKIKTNLILNKIIYNNILIISYLINKYINYYSI